MYGNFLDGTICAPILIGRLIAKLLYLNRFKTGLLSRQLFDVYEEVIDATEPSHRIFIW